jgi:hypothetical protein
MLKIETVRQNHHSRIIPVQGFEVDDQSQQPSFRAYKHARRGTATCLELGISFLPM